MLHFKQLTIKPGKDTTTGNHFLKVNKTSHIHNYSLLVISFVCMGCVCNSIHMILWVHICVSGNVHLCDCEGQRITRGIILRYCPPYFEIGFLTSLDLVKQASWPARTYIYFCFPSPVITSIC